MNLAYLITAYDSPKHLQRLIDALSSNSCAFFIHIDRRSSLGNFSDVSGDNVHLAQERLSSYWGDFSTVKAILVLLRMALADSRRFDYFVLLSGTTYPLQPVSYIERFFEDNSGKEFMQIDQMPLEGKPLSRLTTYKPRSGDSKIAKLMERLAVKSGEILAHRDYRSHFGNVIPFGGSAWWALSREACEYIQRFVHNETRIVKFFAHTLIPEESFFQTIVGNSPFKEKTGRSLTYVDWSCGGARPAYLTKRHLDDFRGAGSVTLRDADGEWEVLFARKFSDEAGDLVAELDRLIRKRSERQGDEAST